MWLENPRDTMEVDPEIPPILLTAPKPHESWEGSRTPPFVHQCAFDLNLASARLKWDGLLAGLLARLAVHDEIRPHRFGGEGVLIGGQNSNTKCSMTFVNIAVAISALAGGAKNGFAPRPEYGGVFDIFRGFLGVWAQEGIEMEFWVILVAFRQWKNGQEWKNIVHSKILQGFWMPEHWKHCKNKCFGLTL